MKKLIYKGFILICLMISVTLGFSSCKAKQVTQQNQFGEIVKSDTIEMIIHQHKVDCVGVGPQKCLRVKFSKDGQWENFYSEIKGFTHKEGLRYTIRVRRDEMSNPPQDASKYVYTLVEVVNLIPVLGR